MMKLPKEWFATSKKQRTLEKQGCVFIGQEWLDNHEVDLDKECYCGRPNRKKDD